MTVTFFYFSSYWWQLSVTKATAKVKTILYQSTWIIYLIKPMKDNGVQQLLFFALQVGPKTGLMRVVLFMPHTLFAADYLDKRTVKSTISLYTPFIYICRHRFVKNVIENQGTEVKYFL